MVDFKFNWEPELDVHDEGMNEQHKELFRIGRDMEQLILTHCIGVEPKQLLSIIGDLRNFVSYHFYYEEKLMLDAGYENYAGHKAQHEKIQADIDGIDLPELGKNPLKMLNLIRDELVGHIFMHLMSEDKKMAEAINK